MVDHIPKFIVERVKRPAHFDPYETLSDQISVPKCRPSGSVSS